MSSDLHQDVVLHEVSQQIIQHDILVFLSDSLVEIREEYNLEPAGDLLAGDWPGRRLLQELVDMADPLFIVAATNVDMLVMLNGLRKESTRFCNLEKAATYPTWGRSI